MNLPLPFPILNYTYSQSAAHNKLVPAPKVIACRIMIDEIRPFLPVEGAAGGVPSKPVFGLLG